LSIRTGTCLVLASLAVVFAFAEISARLLEAYGHYAPKRSVPAYMGPNPFLFSTLIPNRRTALGGGGSVEVNSLGFRGAEIAVEKPPGTFRIVALGGSTTFGYHLSIKSTQDTYPYKLEQELRRRLPARQIEVVNAGVPGYTMRMSLLNFVTRITWLDPDMIIVYHGANDASAFRSQDDLARSVVEADITSVHAIGTLERLIFGSYAFLDLRYRIPRLLSKLEAGRDGVSQRRGPNASQPHPPRDVPLPSTLAAHERHLRDLVLAARDAGTRVAVVRQATVAVPDCTSRPDSHRRNDAEQLQDLICMQIDRYYPHLDRRGIERTLESIAEIQRRIADEFDLIWIDANEAIPDTPEYHSDMCHLWPAGTALLARTIADGLEARIPATP